MVSAGMEVAELSTVWLDFVASVTSVAGDGLAAVALCSVACGLAGIVSEDFAVSACAPADDAVASVFGGDTAAESDVVGCIAVGRADCPAAGGATAFDLAVGLGLELLWAARSASSMAEA